MLVCRPQLIRPDGFSANAVIVQDEAAAEAVKAELEASGKPLFLVNHWVAASPPNSNDASLVNARSFVLERTRRCRAARSITGGMIVAVDFAGTGDVVGPSTS